MAEETNNKSGSRALTLLVIVLLLGMMGMNAYMLLRDTGGDSTASAAEAEESEPLQDPIFVKVGPMTVNLPSDNRSERLLYTSVMIKVGNETTEKFLQLYIPEINDRMLGLLSQQNVEMLTASDGKSRLADAMLALIQRPFAEGQPSLAIESVLFQDFIVQ